MDDTDVVSWNSTAIDYGGQLADSTVAEVLGQSLCLIFAFFAGFFQGFFGCLLAWCARWKPPAGQDPATPTPLWVSRLNIAGVVGSATLPGVLSIAALAFGAISMVVVVRSSSILVFNVIFTRVFNLGSVKKNDAIGTALCLLGIVALFKVAPTDASVTDADFIALVLDPESITWNCVLVFACIVCIFAVLFLERRAAEKKRAAEEMALHSKKRAKAGKVHWG
ncbi:hypothetical protein T492DRAFT_118660 [Pavlovales sp. CCMP2436]|nr:hypothetical protein T492DRAFT_118660 [Pavlovales sp. CCMP2436]